MDLPVLTQEQLKVLIDYNPETGDARWKENTKFIKTKRRIIGHNPKLDINPKNQHTSINKKIYHTVVLLHCLHTGNWVNCKSIKFKDVKTKTPFKATNIKIDQSSTEEYIEHDDLLFELNYDEESGKFKDSNGNNQNLKRRYSRRNTKGERVYSTYYIVMIDKKTYNVSRLAIFYKTGEWHWNIRVKFEDGDAINTKWENIKKTLDVLEASN